MPEITEEGLKKQEEVIEKELDDIFPETEEKATEEVESGDENTEIETPVEDEKKEEEEVSEESEELDALKDAPDWATKEKWLVRRLGKQEAKHKQASREDKQRIKELETLIQSFEIKKSQEKAQIDGILTEEQKQEIQRQEIEMQNQQFQLNEFAKEQRFAEKMQEKAVNIEDFSESILQLGNSGNFTETMLLAAKNSPNGPDVIYHLSKNQKEAARISRLPLEQQIREMYLAEASMLNRAKPIKSSAPPPIDSTKAIPKSKTSDPTEMSFAQMVEAEKNKYG